MWSSNAVDPSLNSNFSRLRGTSGTKSTAVSWTKQNVTRAEWILRKRAFCLNQVDRQAQKGAKTMKALWVDSNGVLNARAGTYINDSIAEAIELSANEGRLVTFYACWGVTVNVRADSNAELILRDWERAADEKIPKNIGPYPTPDLSREERKSDMRINAANLNDWRTREVARKAENRAKREAFETKFASVPIELIDTAWWGG